MKNQENNEDDTVDNNENKQQSDIEAICDAMSTSEQKAALDYLKTKVGKPNKDEVLTDDRQDDSTEEQDNS